MDTVEDYVQKHSVEKLVEKIQEFDEASVEQHKLPKESKVVSVEDWFEFLWSLDDVFSSPIVGFNYIKVEDEAVKYVEKSSGVEEEDLVKHVNSKVPSATEDDVRDWLFNMTFSTAEFNENEELVGLERSFDDSVY